VANSIFIVAGDHHDDLSFRSSVYLLESFLKNRLIHRCCCFEWSTDWVWIAKRRSSQPFLMHNDKNIRNSLLITCTNKKIRTKQSKTQDLPKEENAPDIHSVTEKFLLITIIISYNISLKRFKTG